MHPVTHPPSSPGPRGREEPRCIVLGGNGFVGSAMVQEGRRRGYATLAVSQNDYGQHVGSSCDLLVNANGNSKKYLATRDPAADYRLSVESVMKSLRDFNARHYVYISSIDVYPDVTDPSGNAEKTAIDEDRLSPYGRHKHQAETLVRQHAPSWRILRVGGLVGPRLWKNSIYDLLTGRPLRVHPDSRYQYLHTELLARLSFEMAEGAAWEEIVNVAGDGAISLAEIARLVPGCQLSIHAGAVPLEHYEIDIGKLKSRFAVPSTLDTVTRFIAAVREGREQLATSG